GVLQEWLGDERLGGARLVVVTCGAVAAGPGVVAADVVAAAVGGLVRAAQAEGPGRVVRAGVDVGGGGGGGVAAGGGRGGGGGGGGRRRRGRGWWGRGWPGPGRGCGWRRVMWRTGRRWRRCWRGCRRAAR